METHKSIIGSYGVWANSLRPTIGTLSFRQPLFSDVTAWRNIAKEAVRNYLGAKLIDAVPVYRVDKRYLYDGLSIEEISWQLPYGARTRAIVLKPIGMTGPLPAVLALHDHGGQKFFGYEKITQTSSAQHPLIVEHQRQDYQGRAWANELAKSGFVVMVHDVFAFGSRRVHYKDVAGITWGDCKIKDQKESSSSEDIAAYNTWAAAHESVMAKALLSAGTTWPGVVLEEDRIALSILASRKDVDAEKLGCGGLSGGGLRTTYLAGLDDRIKCAVCVGFMTTWSDLILHKAYTHTWMTYLPLVANDLEFAEVLGLRVPLPTLVLNNNQDELFTLEEMKKAAMILSEVYEKAGYGDNHKTIFYEGRHKFDLTMQQEAFKWFGKWLNS